MTQTKQKSIILFDGVCNLCNGAIQFVITRDRNNKFIFASLQSSSGQDLLLKFGLNISDFDSFVLIANQQYYTKSTAALKVAQELGGIWQLLYCFIIIPKFIRDGIYDFVSRNRYKWFGKKDQCMLPTPALKEKFLL